MAAASAREFFDELAARTAGGSERTRGLRATYRFDVDGVGSWVAAVDDGAVSIREGDDAADCVIGASEETFLKIVAGKQNPLTALLTGKIRLEGDTALAMRLRDLLG